MSIVKTARRMVSVAGLAVSAATLASCDLNPDTPTPIPNASNPYGLQITLPAKIPGSSSYSERYCNLRTKHDFIITSTTAPNSTIVINATATNEPCPSPLPLNRALPADPGLGKPSAWVKSFATSGYKDVTTATSRDPVAPHQKLLLTRSYIDTRFGDAGYSVSATTVPTTYPDLSSVGK
jgi:hypothetical protein